MGDVAGLLKQADGLAEAERVELLGSLLEREGTLGLARMLAAVETKFGVKAAGAGVATAGPAVAGPAKAEAPSSFDVILKNAGATKINVIKVIREVTGLDLMGAKGLADKGGDVKKGLPKEEADALAKKFKEAGAEIEVKPA